VRDWLPWRRRKFCTNSKANLVDAKVEEGELSRSRRPALPPRRDSKSSLSQK